MKTPEQKILYHIEQIRRVIEEAHEQTLEMYNVYMNMSSIKEMMTGAPFIRSGIRNQYVNVVRCKDCFHADDFDCPAPLPTGYLCQKGHGSHMGDWFCADGEQK